MVARKPKASEERTEICRECRFSHIERGDGLRCRLMPPVFVYDYQTGVSTPQNVEVNPDHWCGQFKAPLNS